MGPCPPPPADMRVTVIGRIRVCGCAVCGVRVCGVAGVWVGGSRPGQLGLRELVRVEVSSAEVTA